MRIRVFPSELRTLAVQWREVVRSLEEIGLRLRGAWHGLDWEVKQEAALEALWTQALRQATTLTDEAERLARFLDERAAAFEQADSEGASRLAHASGTWLASLGGTAALASPAWMRFPSDRTAGYLQMGDFLAPGRLPASAVPVQVEPWERRALAEFAFDKILDRLGLSLLKDVLDVTRIPAWNQRVDQAAAAWQQAVLQQGRDSPAAQAAYGHYLETLIFDMPFFGNKVQALVALLNLVARANPVE